jgi:hypothetical protein
VTPDSMDGKPERISQGARDDNHYLVNDFDPD